MKTTRADARRVLRRIYPNPATLYQFNITPVMRIASVPLADEQRGIPTLAWRAERKRESIAQHDDVVFIGRVTNPGEPGPMIIDWSWEETFQLYRLPDGTVVRVDASAAKGAPTIGYTLVGGEVVTASLVQPVVAAPELAALLEWPK